MNKVVNLKNYQRSLNTGAGFVKRFLWYYVNILVFNHHFIPISSLKVFLLRIFGAKIGNAVVIKPKVNIKYPWKLEIGHYSWVGESVWIDNLDLVKLGKNVVLSQGCLLLSGNHDYTSENFDLITKAIVLHDGVWIGARAIVTAGVEVGSHAVLSVNSVASKNLEPYAIYSGNPAIFRKKREIK